MRQKIKKLLLVSRPISWPNTAYPFAAAWLVSGGGFGPVFWAGVGYFLIPYNLLMYGINDVFDYESDIRNPRKGGIEGSKEERSFHPLIIKTALITNAPFVVFLISQGSRTAGLVLVLLIFFVVAYSLAGLRFKEIPLLDSVTSSCHFVGPMVYALTLTGFSTLYVPFVLAFFLWGIASHAFGAVQDILPDREGGLSSVATVFGARRTVRLVMVLYIASGLILISQGGYAIFVGVLVALPYVLNVAPFLSTTDKTSAQTNIGWRRFIWLNFYSGFIITVTLLTSILT